MNKRSKQVKRLPWMIASVVLCTALAAASCNSGNGKNDQASDTADSTATVKDSVASVVTESTMAKLSAALEGYSSVGSFHEGLACVMKNGKYGFINKEGKLVIPCRYDNTGEGFCDGLVCAVLDDKTVFIDHEGTVVFENPYTLCSGYYSEGLMAVGVVNEMSDYEDVDFLHYGKMGFLDTTGKMVIPADKYELPIMEGPVYYSFSEGLCRQSADSCTVFINKRGRVVVRCKGYAGDFHEDMAWFFDDSGQYGFIDRSGDVVIPCQFDAVGDFSEGLCWVQRGDKCGYIDKTGRAVIPLVYDVIALYEDTEAMETLGSQFREGRCWLAKGGRFGCLDAQGNVIIPFRYAPGYNPDGEWFEQAPVFDFHEGLARVWKDGKYGFVNRDGEEVFSCQFDQAQDMSEGLAAVCRNDKWGYIDAQGQCTMDN